MKDRLIISSTVFILVTIISTGILTILNEVLELFKLNHHPMTPIDCIYCALIFAILTFFVSKNNTPKCT